MIQVYSGNCNKSVNDLEFLKTFYLILEPIFKTIFT